MSAMTSAIDQLQRLEQLVPMCESIRRGTEYVAALSRAVTEVRKLDGVLQRIENLEPGLRMLRETDQPSSTEMIRDLEKLEAAGHGLQQCVNAEALKDVRFSVRDIEESVQRMEASVSKAWTVLVRTEFGPLDRLGKVLAGFADTKREGIELQKWAAEGLELAVGIPTAKTIEQFAETRGDVRRRLDALGKLGIDAAVSSFLLEIANNKATLAHVTPHVLDWLESMRARSRFRIELI